MTKPNANVEKVRVSAPNYERVEVGIEGLEQYVQHKFSEKSKLQIMLKQQQGSQSQKGKKREKRDFDKECEAAKHISVEGWCGIPAAAIRCAMIDACRTIGYKMTLGKMAMWVIADGHDVEDGTPLIKITKGKPKRVDTHVRLETGVASVVARPHWAPGWKAIVRIEYDSDMFDRTDVVNLLSRAGRQVGIGEGRPFSSNSCGQGWGIFKVVGCGSR